MVDGKEIVNELRGVNQEAANVHAALEREHSKHGRWMDFAFSVFLVGFATAAFAIVAAQLGWKWFGLIAFFVVAGCVGLIWAAMAYGLVQSVRATFQRMRRGR